MFPDLTPLDFVTQATLDPVPTALIVVTTGLYLWGVHRLKARGRQWPRQRTLFFLTGQFLMVVALLSGLAAYDDTSFSIHTIQHILLSMLAPIFYAFSAPVTLLLQASNRRIQTGALKVIHGPVGRLLSHPVFTWPLYGVSLFALYFTSLYADTLTNNTLHQFVHLHLLITGCLFYWPVIALDPLPRRLNFGVKILYLMLAVPFHTILGMALESQTTPIAPHISLYDLHVGGAMMWVSGEALGLIGTIAVFIQWLRADERQARRNDRANEAAAEKQLALWRATREAAARAASTSA